MLGLQGNLDMPAWLMNPDYERPGWVRCSAIDKSHVVANAAARLCSRGSSGVSSRQQQQTHDIAACR